MRRTLAILALAIPLFAAELKYQKPPKEVLDVMNAPLPPTLAVNPAHTYATLAVAARYPSIVEVSQPMLRLAGERINPKNNGPHVVQADISLSIMKLPSGATTPVALPAGARIGHFAWAPDGKMLAFSNTTNTSIDLWLCDPATAKAHKVEGVKLNPILAGGGGRGGFGGGGGGVITWLADNHTILAKIVPPTRGAAPPDEIVPLGPHIQETSGRTGVMRTYEDLLQTPHDEDAFEYYATSQLALIDSSSGAVTPIGKSGILEGVSPSPDGKDFLVTAVHRPFSYLVPVNDFPKDIAVWDRAGKVVFKVASLPLADHVPIGGVLPGARQVRWEPSAAATLIWVEALDGGNPKENVPHRDHLVALKAPFQDQPSEVFKTEERFQGMQFGEKNIALVEDFNRMKRWVRTFEIDAAKPNDSGKVIWSRNNQDRYKDPGTPVQHELPNGQRVFLQSGDWIFLDGAGATPNGDHPFLDKYNLATGETQHIFRCDDSHYESVVAVLDESHFITRRESPTEPPNYYLHSGTAEKALTHYADPTPQIRGIHKELITYKRADGVPLSFTLYLPAGYNKGTALPTVLWAYPYEYNDADTAGQITGSTQRFTTIGGYSELFFALEGYAVLAGTAMPIVGSSPETVNDTYIEQVVADAQAAIDKAVSMGVTDRNRVGVGGHSYGAFMTGNLLAHTRFFRAGIAESGAYNRTLTPFGFQTEERTLWQVPELYLKMSPFMYADKIKDAILMIHGEADDNSGTFPINSERLYAAVKGLGGTARLVMLPDEAHGYRAKETIEHVNWEKISWFDKYVKNAGDQKPRGE